MSERSWLGVPEQCPVALQAGEIGHGDRAGAGCRFRNPRP